MELKKLTEKMEVLGDDMIALSGEILSRRTAFVAYCDTGYNRILRDEAELLVCKLEHFIRVSGTVKGSTPLDAMAEHRRFEAQSKLIRLALLLAGSLGGLLCGWGLAELIDRL